MRALSMSHPPRAARRLAGAVLSVAVVGITASTAFAAGGDGAIATEPHRVRPGGTVTLSTHACGPGASAGVDAGSLGAGILGLEPKDAGAKDVEAKDAEAKTAKGELHIPPDTEPGNYAIGGSCADGRELTGTVVVGDGKSTARNREPAKGAGEARTGVRGDEWPEDEGWESWPEDDGGAVWPEDEGTGDQGSEDQSSEDGGVYGKDDRPDRHDDWDDWDGGHDGGHDKDWGKDWGKDWDDGHDRHGKMPHGRVHTGLGGADDDLNAARLTGGSVALAAAAGGVLYLRRRHRGLGG